MHNMLADSHTMFYPSLYAMASYDVLTVIIVTIVVRNLTRRSKSHSPQGFIVQEIYILYTQIILHISRAISN